MMVMMMVRLQFWLQAVIGHSDIDSFFLYRL